ncbi:DMT family transporter [Brevibacillus sp. TJ4]
MNSSYKTVFHPYVLLFISVLAIAVSSILIKSSDAPASVAGMYRLLITVLILSPFVPWKPVKAMRLSAAEWGLVCTAGVFLGLHFLFWMESLSYTSVASSMVILTLQPFFVMVGSYFLFRERVTIGIVLCMAASLAGSVLIAWGDMEVSRQALIGDGLSLLGTIAIAVYLLAGQKLSGKIPANVYSIMVFGLGGLVLLAYSVAQGYSLTEYDSSEWTYFLLLAIIPTVFGHFLFNLLLNTIGATTVSVGVIGEPVLAIILAYLLLGEVVGAMQVAGGLLTLIGMGMYFWLRSGQARTVTDTEEKGRPL